MHLVARLLDRPRCDFTQLVVLLWDLSPLVEALHPAVEKLVIPVDQALLGLAEVGEVEPSREVGEHGRDRLLPANVVASVEQHPRLAYGRAELTDQPFLALLEDELLAEREEQEGDELEGEVDVEDDHGVGGGPDAADQQEAVVEQEGDDWEVFERSAGSAEEVVEDLDEEDCFEEEEDVLAGQQGQGWQHCLDEDAVRPEGQQKRHRDIGHQVKESHLHRAHFVLPEPAVEQHEVLVQPA